MLFRSEPIGKHISWMVEILPHIEAMQIYKSFDYEKGVYDPVNATLRRAQVRSFLCPSSPETGMKRDDDVAISSYAACYGDSEVPLDEDNNGVFYLNSRTRFSDITDGSSNTLFIGEKVAMAGDMGWMSGSRSTIRNGIVSPLPDSKARSYVFSSENPDKGSLVMGGMSSYHSSAILICLGDGSVRTISMRINPKIFAAMATRNGGELDSFFGEDW